MKWTAKKAVLIVLLAIPAVLVFADEYPALRFRGDGQFSGGPVLGYWIRFRPIPFHEAGEYIFHFRGMPRENMTLQLYTVGEYDRSVLTNLDTRLEASVTDQQGRTVCQGVGVVPTESRSSCDDCKVWTEEEIKAREQREWILMSGADEAAYYHANCVGMPMKPRDAYTLRLRILAIDPKTPRINLVPTLEGGQLDLP